MQLKRTTSNLTNPGTDCSYCLHYWTFMLSRKGAFVTCAFKDCKLQDSALVVHIRCLVMYLVETNTPHLRIHIEIT